MYKQLEMIKDIENKSYRNKCLDLIDKYGFLVDT